MLSNSSQYPPENYEHNVFRGILVGKGQEQLFNDFQNEQDLSVHTIEAIQYDIRKFASWFTTANQEAWDVTRVTVRDVADFKDYLYREKKLAAATINRNLASIRKYCKWLCSNGYIAHNPCLSVKELKKQPTAPQGLSRSEVRKLLREAELRGDIRAKALFNLVLYTGARLSDIVFLELTDLQFTPRSGTVHYRYGKGSKQRKAPLPLQARNAISEYQENRPQVKSQRVFVGERGALNARGVQAIFEKYRALTGIENLHCHVLRHTFSHNFLKNGNLTQLAQILGHESLSTTAIYTKNSLTELSDISEQLSY